MASLRGDAIKRQNRERLDADAERLSLAIQLATGIYDGAREDLKQMLIEFAEEIKRQAIEP